MLNVTHLSMDDYDALTDEQRAAVDAWLAEHHINRDVVMAITVIDDELSCELADLHEGLFVGGPPEHVRVWATVTYQAHTPIKKPWPLDTHPTEED